MSAKNPDHLFKYLDAEGAIDVLQTRSLRWSSPDCLGDPLELGANSPLPFDVASLLDSTIKLASSMIFAPEEPKGDSPLINAIKRWRGEGRFASPAEATGVLRELLGKMVQHRKAQLEDAVNQWRDYIRNIRICCFSSKIDSLQNWEKFADHHRGVALRFDFTAAPFGSAQPVIYQSERPQLTTIREQLGAILHNRKDAMVERYKDLHLTKSGHLKAEAEWRCKQTASQRTTVDHDDSSQWRETQSFSPDGLSAIFLGLCCDETTKQRVRELAQEHFSKAKVYQGVLSKTGYAIEFEKVTS